MRNHLRRLALVVILIQSAQLLPFAAEPAAAAVHLPGFQLETVWSGLESPTAIAFAQNGRVFVAERSGLIKTFDTITDQTAEVAADLRAKVHDFDDRGLLGLAVDPSFPGNPYIYVAYVLDAPPGGTAPFYHDACPLSPNTHAKDGCPAPGRISRLTINPSNGHMTGTELVLLGDGFYCYQQQALALDHIEFGPDGALYASSGEGATASFTDWGQHSGDPEGVEPNACGDPPVPAGSQLSLPTTEGGALRSQDIRTSSDPGGGGGSIIRINPATGAALPDNPLIGDTTGDDRHVAYGLRNPFRFTFRPGTSEIWVGDVGLHTWEELNVVPNPTQQVRNFGWPCYEGSPKQPQWDNLNVNLCESLYQAGPTAVSNPYWSYRHDQSPDPTRCGHAGSSISAVAFASSPPYPAAYGGALFVGDYSKQCLWILPKGANGQPNPAGLQTLASGVFPVDLEDGPGGTLYYVDFGLGEVNRINYFSGNEPPVAHATATPQFGAVPLNVQFDGSSSTDADGPLPLQYAWDLDADGAFDDSTLVNPTRQYAVSQNVNVGLRVSDGMGAMGFTTIQVQPGNTPPQVVIENPTSGSAWSAGDLLAFSGTATDDQDGSLSLAMEWSVILQHCPVATDCHAHPQIERVGPTGSFDAPEHEYPAYLEFVASATDSRGATTDTTLALQPVTGDLTFLTNPLGLQLLAGAHEGSTPFTITAISGSRVSVTAPSPQTGSSGVYAFGSWSDGGAASHEVLTVPGTSTFTANYQPVVGWAVVGTGAQATQSGSTGTTVAVPYPTGIQAGDLLLLGCQGRQNNQDWSAPGFGSLARTTVVSGLRHEVLSAWASGPLSGSLTVTNTTGLNGWSCQLTALRGGVGSGSPLDAAAASGNGTGSTMTSPSVTAVTPGALATRWYASLDDNSHGLPSTGSLAFGGLAYDTDVGLDHGASMASVVQSAAGPSGTASMAQQANGPDAWSAITLVLKPGGAGGPTNTPPIANDQSVVALNNAPLTVTLTASDPDPDPLTYRVTALPAHGQLYAGSNTTPEALIGSGSLPYTLPGNQVTFHSAPGYIGPDAWSFSVSDGLASDGGQITLDVRAPPPASGWAVVGTGAQATQSGSTGTTVAVPYPTGIQAGDLLLLGCQGRQNNQDWSAPGFGSLARTTVVSGLRHEVLSAWASGPLSGSLTVTNTTGLNGWSCQLTALRGGVGSGSPLDAAAASGNGTGSTMTSPSVTAVTPGALATRWYASLDDNSHGLPSTGSLAFGGLAYDTDVGLDHGASMASVVQSAAGPSGTASMAQQANGPDAWSAITLVLKPGP